MSSLRSFIRMPYVCSSGLGSLARLTQVKPRVAMLLVAHIVKRVAVTKNFPSTAKLALGSSQAFSRPLQAQAQQDLAKFYGSRTESQSEPSGIGKVLSTKTANKLRRDSEAYLDDMRRFLTKQKKGDYWDKEACHMDEDHLLERFTDAICKKDVNYEDILIVAKTLRDIQNYPLVRLITYLSK